MPWFTLYERTLTSDQNNYGNRTTRTPVAVSAYDGGAPATATKIRVTIQSSSTVGVAWDNIYIGHAAASGDAIDFDGTQVQVLCSGSASGSIAAASTLLSDAVNYAFDKSKPLVVTMHVTGVAASAGVKFLSSATGFATWSLLSGADEAATTDVTAAGYSSSTSLRTFPKVEVFVGDGITAAAGSYTLTGSTAGLVTSGGGTLAAAAGSYALTGAAAGLGPGYQLTGTAATFVDSGAGPKVLTAAAGSYALTGAAVGLGLGYKLTGTDAAFVVGVAGVTTLPAAAGSYTLTGSTAALALRHTLGAAAYTLTGSPASFLAPFNLPAAAGTYTLTGSDATLRVSGSFVLSAASGSYTLTGTAVVFIPPTGPVEPTSPGGVGSVSRGRMIRKRRKREEEEEPIPVIGSTPVAEAPPGPSLPPQPGLMAHMPPVQPAKIPKRADPDEDEDEIALLLELIS